jgi:protein involved in polysaccharide export with SLBB domain
LLVGSSPAQTFAAATPAIQAQAKPAATTDTNAAAGAAAASANDTDKDVARAYKLQPGDRVLYRVLQDPVRATDPETLGVNALGEIHFPISRGSATVVTVGVRARTLDDVRGELKRRLDADYYYDAEVELKLLDRTVRTGQVLVYGRGVRGGAIVLAAGEQKTLFEAILHAGPTEFANLRKVRLHRVDPATQESRSEVIDVEEIKRTGSRLKDVVLQDGDRIEVPEKGVVF